MEKYKPSKHEWGKPASTRYAKTLTPGEKEKMDKNKTNESWPGKDLASKISKFGDKERKRKEAEAKSPKRGTKRLKWDEKKQGYVLEKTDPCWKGYKQLGMKKKNGKEVPNCVPEETLDEVSKATKDSYIQKAVDDHAHSDNVARNSTNPKEKEKYERRRKNRQKGISRAYGESTVKGFKTYLKDDV